RRRRSTRWRPASRSPSSLRSGSPPAKLADRARCGRVAEEGRELSRGGNGPLAREALAHIRGGLAVERRSLRQELRALGALRPGRQHEARAKSRANDSRERLDPLEASGGDES